MQKITCFFSLLFLSTSVFCSVLYIGDSQTAGPLGYMIYKDLKKRHQESEIKVLGIGSSSPRHWSSSPQNKHGKWLCKRKGRLNDNYQIPLRDSICSGQKSQMVFEKVNSFKPDTVVFQFLGNSVGFDTDYVKRKVRKLLDKIEGQDCLFITSPPHYIERVESNQKRNVTEEAIVTEINGRCEIYRGMQNGNMQNFATQRDNYVGDKIHLTRKGARLFFEQIKPYLP